MEIKCSKWKNTSPGVRWNGKIVHGVVPGGCFTIVWAYLRMVIVVLRCCTIYCIINIFKNQNFLNILNILNFLIYFIKFFKITVSTRTQLLNGGQSGERFYYYDDNDDDADDDDKVDDIMITDVITTISRINSKMETESTSTKTTTLGVLRRREILCWKGFYTNRKRDVLVFGRREVVLLLHRECLF